jgi:YspA, cpYpsA-related SLOG family
MADYRVLVTGSRTWTDAGVIAGVLAGHYREGAVLVSGACPRGADALAEEYWALLGGRVERHPADWAGYGRRAGFVRNAQMVSAGADVCVAFIRDGSPGATHCAVLARAAGIETEVYRA